MRSRTDSALTVPLLSSSGLTVLPTRALVESSHETRSDQPASRHTVKTGQHDLDEQSIPGPCCRVACCVYTPAAPVIANGQHVKATVATPNARQASQSCESLWGSRRTTDTPTRKRVTSRHTTSRVTARCGNAHLFLDRRRPSPYGTPHRSVPFLAHWGTVENTRDMFNVRLSISEI